MLKLTGIILLCGTMLTTLPGAVVPVRDGAAQGKIFVAETAQPAEQRAAREIRSYIQKITGAEMAVVHDASDSGIAIYVGPDGCPEKLVPDNAAPDRIVLKTVGDKLFVSGGRPRGTLYAAFELIEQYFGVRLLAPDEEFIPKTATLELPEIHLDYTPQFTCRDLMQSSTLPMQVQCRSNGNFGRFSAEDGYANGIVGFCHTFYDLLPPEKYYDQHPEWYGMSSGVRLKKDGQLCLSNPEMRREFIKNVLARLRQSPGTQIISVSQNDNGAYCTCPECNRIAAAEGSESGNIIRFVNEVAAAVQKEFPETIVETLAYQYGKQPPRLARPAENVMIRLCSDSIDFSVPVTHPKNAEFASFVSKWAAISRHLGIWHYAANYANSSIPHPNWQNWEEDFRFFRDHKVIYVLVEADHFGNERPELGELRAYLLRNLLWDPSRSEAALTDEFLKLYYGPAADAVARYLELLKHEAAKPNARLPFSTMDTSSWLSLGALLQARRIIGDAIAANSGRPELVRKLQRIEFTLNVALLLRGEYAGYNDKRADYPPIDFEAVLRSVDAGRREWVAYGLGIPWDENKFQQLAKLIAPPQKSGTAPPFCKGLPENAWLEFQDCEFRFRPPQSEIDDPKASDGKTCKYQVPNNWLIQCDLPANASLKNNWYEVYVSVHCEGENPNLDAVAIQAGCYNNRTKWNLETNGSYKDYVQPDYQWMKIGRVNLCDPFTVWVLVKPNVTAYVDRIVIVKAKP